MSQLSPFFFSPLLSRLKLVATKNLLIKDGALASSSTRGEGSGLAGDLRVNASESIQVIGTSANAQFSSNLSTQTEGSGNAGDLIINTKRLLVQGGAQIGSGTFIDGQGGNLIVNASESVKIRDPSEDGRVNSGLFTQTEGTGDAKDLIINTPLLLIQNGGQISAATTSNGNSGNIIITGKVVKAINGGQFLTTTEGNSRAGNITLNISDELELSGSNSGIFANTEIESSGNGGNIFIDPRTIIIQDGATITVDSQGSGEGGNIQILGDSLTLSKGIISADTASNTGGDISLQIEGLLFLDNSSQISTSAGTAQAGGDGGNIEINSPLIISIPSNPFNTITANAFEGDGGNIEITTNAIFGGEFLIIDASSQLGIDGEVIINDPDVDPTNSLSNLPQNTVKVEVAQGCQTVGGRSTLEFFVIGRGGLPPTPDDLFSSEIVIAEWIPLYLADEKVQEQTLETSFTEEEITNLSLLTNLSCPRN